MPYNFLFSLLQKSENPEYVMKVIDLLLKDSEVVLMIQDQLKVGVYEEEHYQAEKIVKETYKKETSVVNSGTGGSTGGIISNGIPGPKIEIIEGVQDPGGCYRTDITIRITDRSGFSTTEGGKLRYTVNGEGRELTGPVRNIYNKTRWNI